MKRRIFIVFILIMILILTLACSRPASQPHRYLSDFDETPNEIEPIDLSEITDPEEVDPLPEDELDITPHFFRDIPPQDLPRAMHQFSIVIELLKDFEKQVEEFGETPYRFRMNRSVFATGDIIHEHGGDVSPIPLFKTWDSSGFNNIDSVEAWVHNSNIVEIRGQRRTKDGNWYRVRLPHSGIDEISGWIHESMLKFD